MTPDIDLKAEPRSLLQGDKLAVELPVTGTGTDAWLARFNALARAEDISAQIKDPFKKARIIVTLPPGATPDVIKKAMDDARGLAVKAGEPEAVVGEWWREQKQKGPLQYSLARTSLTQPNLNLTTIAQYMFWLMLRNVASAGFVFEDPVRADVLSRPGCVLASPSWDNSATHVKQDYVYNWTRDAAIVAIELAADPLPDPQPLIDYVQFAQTSQDAAAAFGHFDRASFLIDGTPRD